MQLAEASEREVEFDVARRREVRRGVAGLVLSMLLIGAGPTLDGARVLTGFIPVLILLAGLVVGGVSLASLVHSRFRRGQLTIDRDGVRLGDDFIPRAAITSAWFSPGAGRLRASVRLVGDGDRELAQVAGIGYYDRGDVVRRKEGEIRIPTAQPARFANDYDRALQQGLFTRASQALAAYRSGGQPDAAARVTRRGRAHGEWIRDLFDREGSFRVAPVLDDQLWRVVESPTAEATARAGAAVVLARTADESGRSRLRIAADACTAPRLRIVLDRTASGASEAEVEEALVEVEEEDDTRWGA